MSKKSNACVIAACSTRGIVAWLHRDEDGKVGGLTDDFRKAVWFKSRKHAKRYLAEFAGDLHPDAFILEHVPH